MTRVYYREAVGALVVFDMTRLSTFQAVLKWKGDLDSKVALGNGTPVPAVLLANKCDQRRHGLCPKLPKLESFCNDYGFVGWYETSAKVRRGSDRSVAVWTLICDRLSFPLEANSSVFTGRHQHRRRRHASGGDRHVCGGGASVREARGGGRRCGAAAPRLRRQARRLLGLRQPRARRRPLRRSRRPAVTVLGRGELLFIDTSALFHVSRGVWFSG
ncbi:ras-related protein Rab-32 isoform X4 [Betta splendens]|nr:ras-related protein Rab-32 isoform X4 [Betta splendens]XP_055362995.1 ras-related protein Rab-32 isoform X4 [Betta splendens]XP_055362996.1 ras-related protein Rab-32 isoform X4 [Betta splendens]XP_055362997.1 ras-related protein Rab-32 isoform X4 [Betta splendens]